ncbi:MAG: DUF2723 domain-containing protein [Verrucomicrobia bacterium]|nr:DUF2723 domain-containing protein [Verrucomicrobiota bacterium]
MNDNTENPTPSDESLKESLAALPATSAATRFFQRSDWLSFAVTTTLVLVVYLWTLAPNVTLEDSGIFSVAAMYAGVPQVPGFPVWTIYGWLFTKLLPFSNIAWRVAVSSAVAGALTCGLIALMVSRGGALMLEGISGLKRLTLKEENVLRVVCGAVAGMGLGFDGAFWREALIVGPWPLSVLSLSVCICLLFRWFYSPERRRYLYAAVFVYGVTLTCSQSLAPAVVGLPFVVVLADTKLGRDFLSLATIAWVAVWVERQMGYLSALNQPASIASPLWALYLAFGIITTTICVCLTVKTRSFFTEWKAIMLLVAMFLLGLSPYLYVPLASMTSPPVNWGYARTVEGFVHVLTRGQFERTWATEDFAKLAGQIPIYGEITVRQFGLLYAIVAMIPFCFLHKIRTWERRWMLSLVAIFFGLSFLMLVLLNPSPDRQSVEMVGMFFTASHLVVAVWVGYGLILLGSFLARKKTA